MRPSGELWSGLLVLAAATAGGCAERGGAVADAVAAGARSGASRAPIRQQALRAVDEEDRARAVWALGSFGDAESLPVLRSALTDDSAFVRAMAAEALGRSESLEAVPSLLPCLEDPDPHVQRAAVTALSRFDRPEVRAALEDYFRRRPVGVSAEERLRRIRDK